MTGRPRRLAWKRARDWEHRCRNFFRADGFRAERFDESNGFAVGVDVLLSVWIRVLHAWKWATVPAAIQCKCSKTPGDLFKGLNEARRGWKKAKLFICLHWFREDNERCGHLRIAHSTDQAPGAPYELLKGRFDAILEHVYAVIPTTEDTSVVLQNTIDQQYKEANERR